jgi:hypothetical protein
MSRDSQGPGDRHFLILTDEVNEYRDGEHRATGAEQPQA